MTHMAASFGAPRLRRESPGTKSRAFPLQKCDPRPSRSLDLSHATLPDVHSTGVHKRLLSATIDALRSTAGDRHPAHVSGVLGLEHPVVLLELGGQADQDVLADGVGVG